MEFFFRFSGRKSSWKKSVSGIKGLTYEKPKRRTEISMEQSNSPDLEQSLEEIKKIMERIEDHELPLVTIGERYYKTIRPLVYCLEWRPDVEEFVEEKFEEVEKFIQDLHTEWYVSRKETEFI